MSHAELAKVIDSAFEERERIGPSTKGPVREAVPAALDVLGDGEPRVAERQPRRQWEVNQCLDKAVLQ